MKKLATISIIFCCAVSLNYNCQAQDIPLNPPAQKLGDPANPAQKEVKVFTFVEQMPQFPGGDAALSKFVNDNMHYPEAAKANGTEGTVYVQFIVEPTGEIKYIKILKDPGSGCGEEAVRLVKLMPKWIPGKQNGNLVAVEYNLPIKFVISKG